MPNSEELNPFSFKTWVTWVCVAITGMVGVTSFCYTTFETRDAFALDKESRNRYEDEMNKRLDRIENKLDQLMNRLK